MLLENTEGKTRFLRNHTYFQEKIRCKCSLKIDFQCSNAKFWSVSKIKNHLDKPRKECILKNIWRRSTY